MSDAISVAPAGLDNRCGYAELSLLSNELVAVLLAAEQQDGDPTTVFPLLNAGTRLAAILAEAIEKLEVGKKQQAAELLGLTWNEGVRHE